MFLKRASPFNRRRRPIIQRPCRLPLLCLAALLATSGCAARVAEHIPTELGFDAAAHSVGTIVGRSGRTDGARQVIVVKDRHPVTPRFQAVRPQLESIQRSNRLLLEYLVARGFRLLGCERSFGRLVEDDTTRRHYELIRGRLSPVDYLDRFSAYQPIRYDIMFAPRLQIWGVEDVELYEADVASLRRMYRAQSVLRRHDSLPDERDKATTEDRAARRALLENTAERGTRAARNLLAIMADQDIDRAVLMLGGSHASGAIAVLETEGIDYVLFEPTGYEGFQPERVREEAP